MEWVVAIAVAIFGSSGLWAYLASRQKKSDANEMLLKGLAHSALVTQGRYYAKRGWITPEEYSDYYNMLYLPYKQLGGNGSAERIVNAVDSLPLQQPKE